MEALEPLKSLLALYFTQFSEPVLTYLANGCKEKCKQTRGNSKEDLKMICNYNRA